MPKNNSKRKIEDLLGKSFGHWKINTLADKIKAMQIRLMKYLLQLTHREIADAMGVSRGTVQAVVEDRTWRVSC